MTDDDLDPTLDDRFKALDRLDPPDVWNSIALADSGASRGRRRQILASAAVLVVLVGLAVAWGQRSTDGQEDLVVADEPTRSDGVEPPPVGDPDEPPEAAQPAFATLRVSQFQTECCYFEGSTGVLEIVDADGGRVGEIVEAGPLTQVPNGEGAIGFVSDFPEASLAPGRYTVAVWQLDWPFTIADVDRASQLDLCTIDVEVAPSEVLELVATWAPGVGCLSFQPPTDGDTPAVRVACGGALLSRVSSAHAARNELLGDEGEAALAALREIDRDFVDGFGWSTVQFGGPGRVLLGSVVDPVGDGPFLAYAVFESGRPVDWGSCDLEVEATGFALVPFFAVGDSTDDPAGTTLTVRVCEAAANDGRRIAPVVVETPDIVVLAMLVERPPERCATTDRFVDVEVGLGFPWEQRPIIDASVDGGAVRVDGELSAAPLLAVAEDLLAALRVAGVDASMLADPESGVGVEGRPRRVCVAGGVVQVFEFDTEALRLAESTAVTETGQPPRAIVSWVATPRFFAAGRLLALYVGDGAETVSALVQLMGPTLSPLATASRGQLGTGVDCDDVVVSTSAPEVVTIEARVEGDDVGAPFDGVLVADGGCLFYDEDGYRTWIVWPDASRWDVAKAAVVLGDGTVLAVGDRIRGDAVFVDIEVDLPFLPAPARCAEKVSEVLVPGEISP